MKFEICKDKKGQWFFRIRADNGKILCHSEAYSSKRNAVNAAVLVRTDCRSAVVWQGV